MAPAKREKPHEPPATFPAKPGAWVPLFDGRTLDGWRPLDEGPFEGHGDVRVENSAIVLEPGRMQTGISWRGGFPRDRYEVSLEAKRTQGSDFFCGMTFPVGDSPCTLIVGGWGGSIVGLSNVDDQAAVENQTTGTYSFENDCWYRIRLRVSEAKIEAWINGEQVIDLERAGHRFSVWYEQEPVRPFGVSAWETGAALREIRVRRLSSSE
ncbi:MAG: 3-keto-disaccharide hydrolase [Phycisphaerae bacterium]